MADREMHRERVQRLLAQDQEINDTQLKEFRMQLEQNLEAWEASSQRMRRAVVRCVVLFALLYVGSFLLAPASFSLRQALREGWLRTFYMALLSGWFIATVLTFVVGLWLLVVYFYKYAPALKRARFDTQTAMILELQRQVEQLRQDMERRNPT